MESSAIFSRDSDSAAHLPFGRGIGMSTRPMLIRATTGVNLLFPFTLFVAPFKKRKSKHVSRRNMRKIPIVQ